MILKRSYIFLGGFVYSREFFSGRFEFSFDFRWFGGIFFWRIFRYLLISVYSFLSGC